jgi:plastocyanin
MASLKRRISIYGAFAILFGLGLVTEVVGLRSFAAGRADAAEAREVDIANFKFSPGSITIPTGTTVTWVNRDEEVHTVTGSNNPQSFKSTGLDTDDKFSFTFAKPGTYSYFCSFHPYMTAKIIVQ